jgi:DNA modification methylase
VSWEIHQGDCLDILKTLPKQSVNCCVTSPPYFGLRDYGVPGQIGLEQTPEDYVNRLVDVFREVRRVLRDDGVLFLNLGDSYYGSSMTGGTKSKEGSAKRMGRMFEKPSNVQHEDAYDTSGKAPADYQESGCLCENLCDVCREVYLRTSRTYDLLVPMLTVSLSGPTRESMGFVNGHSPTSDFSRLGARIFPAIQRLLHCGGRADEQLRAIRESMPDEFSRQLLDLCWQRGNSSACLLCGRSLTDNVQGFAHMSGGFSGQQMHIQNNALHDAQRGHRSQYKDKACGYCNEILTTDTPPNIQPYCTTNKWKIQLKPKDLVGIPWMVAFALRADGWYLRSDIIWHKPNAMPESVRDRPTKAHEYMFLLSKNQKYYYDADAIKEPSVSPINNRKPNKRGTEAYANASGIGNNAQLFTRKNDGFRNKRTVWTIPTKPFKGAHFAVFPPALVEPCILAGCPVGGVVLDPFAGACTTGIVALQHNRQFVGIELNGEYVDMSRKRMAGR